MLLLFFLSAFAMASRQELFQLQLRRPMHWLPYRSPSQNFHHQLIPYKNPDDEANPFGYGNPMTPEHQLPDFFDGGLQSRNKNREMEEVLTDGSPNLEAQLKFHSNFYWKTATYTMTTTVNVTMVVSCIPLSIFAPNSQTVVCVRKKRGMMMDYSEIDPSEPQQVTMTTVPFVGHLERGNRHLVYDRDLISSSKDDVIVSRDEMTQEGQDSKRQNRFFHNWVTFTTVPYFYINTLIFTKRVLPAGNNQFYCRPSDYPICM